MSPAASSASVAAAAHGVAPRSRAAPAHAGSVFGDTLPYMTRFMVSCPPSTDLYRGPALQGHMEALFAARMPEAKLILVDAVRLGPQAAPRVFITVGSLAQAEVLVQYRHLFKGSGFTVWDMLSPVEQVLHAKLWPSFREAVALGKKAQFHRARLMVEGVRVLA